MTAAQEAEEKPTLIVAAIINWRKFILGPQIFSVFTVHYMVNR